MLTIPSLPINGTELMTMLSGLNSSLLGIQNTSFVRVEDVLSSTTLSYSDSVAPATIGGTLEAGGFRYAVAAVDATDHHLTTAGGIKLYVLPGANGFDVVAFGAVLSGAADSTAAIQAAENAAAAVAAAGGSVQLHFPLGDFAVSGSIVKRAGVNWCGIGTIRRQNNLSATGAGFSLVTADGVDNWSIRGVTLENVAHDRVVSGAVTSSSAFGASNQLIDVRNCHHFRIEGCRLRKYSYGVRVDGCTSFRISGNDMNAESGKTLASVIDGSYTPFASKGGEAIIIGGQKNGIVSARCAYFEVRDNIIDNTGLDVGIFALAYTWDRADGMISGNIVLGGNSGIQCYRSISDPGTAPTYATGLHITGNSVSHTWEQGIYTRGVVGVLIDGNTLYRCSCGGDNGSGAGNTASSIMIRVDPFFATSGFASGSALSNDHTIMVSNNYIVDHGHPTRASNPVIQAEVANVSVIGNTIIRSAEFSTTATCSVIEGMAGASGSGLHVDRNEIQGTFTRGIYLAKTLNTSRPPNFLDTPSVRENILKGSFVNPIYVDYNGFHMMVDGNRIHAAVSGSAAIILRNAPYGSVSDNQIVSAAVNVTAAAIQTRQGCLASDTAYFLSGGTVTRSNRRGGTLRVTGNTVLGYATPFSLTETNVNDSKFYGRCREFRDNVVNGRTYVQEFTTGTPDSTYVARIWHKHDRTCSAAAASGVSPGRVCTAPGQYGSSVATTGQTTAGSAVITNVAVLDGYGPGLYLSVAGFSGTVQIVAIDVTAQTLTVDVPADASHSSVSLASAAPVFTALPALV
ncbi:NosD domain-containing protein [Puniceibacterium sp. IMCC21224]|uniref:NosD domain-containing protein n=1 Tax=Puniceibacterium sp. IMCC21224 TaxID=1618204 RepID=UPI00064E0C3C|nr:NosD domain-containing protein [Puniceibacterium sp. IMCC21224]KMK63824.1 hypothetical protein IMCC21224_1811 [Puniceibacterium sp. IMCC21224]